MAWEETIKANVSGKRGLFLVNVKYTMMTRALVELLDYLLRERRQAGALISIDRPHTFVTRLLEKHNIPGDRLVFLDAITNISGEPALASEMLGLLASPFCINFLNGFTSCHAAKMAASPSGFILMDNLAALSPYMTESCIQKFVGILKSLETECIIVLDKEMHRSLFDFLVMSGASEISVKGDAIPI